MAEGVIDVRSIRNPEHLRNQGRLFSTINRFMKRLLEA